MKKTTAGVILKQTRRWINFFEKVGLIRAKQIKHQTHKSSYPLRTKQRQ